MHNKLKFAAFTMAGALLFASPSAVLATESKVQVSTENETEVSLFDGTYNLLLIGSDRRDKSWSGNSDVMMLLTINKNTKQMFLTSFMRDTGVDIPGVGLNKLNAAYPTGGAQLLEQTLEESFGVSIDNYAAVDFMDVEDIVDSCGGVDLEVTADEVEVLNGYVVSLCEDKDLDPNDYYVSGSGMLHLNGLQTVAYMRNRAIGNDQERTHRQRKVLESLLDQVKNADDEVRGDLTKALLNKTENDLDLFDMLKLSRLLPKAQNYELVTDRVPYDDLYTSQDEMLIPDLEATKERLLSEIYAK